MSTEKRIAYLEKDKEKRRKAYDRLRAAGEDFLAALAEYDASGDHLQHDTGAACMRCNLLAVIGDKAL